jgi:glycerol-3-phosphate dehydrogenase
MSANRAVGSGSRSLNRASLTRRTCDVLQIVYYDGQFDDSRLAVSLACTAALAGANVVNYVEVTRLLKVRLSWRCCSRPARMTC